MKRFVLLLSLFISVLLLAGGILLKRGVQIEHLSREGATLTNLSLRWQKKLDLHIERLDIDPLQDKGKSQALDLGSVERVLPLVPWIDGLFSRIAIETVRFGEISGSLVYETPVCHLRVRSSLADLEATVTLQEHTLLADIHSLRSEQFHSRASGALRFDIREQTGSGKLAANLADSLPVILEFTADSEQLSFHGKENGTITTITPFVELFGLSRNIQRWITDYLKGSRYLLTSFTGNFPWDNPQHLLESFYAAVRVEECEYTFAPGLEPIKTDYTDVDFKNGVLGIVPHDATFYGQDGEDSWLDINFNDFDNIILTTYIVTHAVANTDIVNLLKYYDIPLPFVQTGGKTDTDLTLSINLNREEVTAKGRFQIEDGVIQYQGKPCTIKNAEVTLQDSHISIGKMQLRFEELFLVDLSGFFDAGAQKGDITIVVQDMKLPVAQSVLQLDNSAAKPRLQYHIRPDGPGVEVSESFWKLDSLPLHLGAFHTPFSFAELSGELPPTLFTVPEQFEAEIAGPFSLKEQKVDLQCSLGKVHIGNVELKSHETPIRIRYENGLFVQSLKRSQWNISQIPFTLFPARAIHSEDILSVSSEKVVYGDFFEAKVSGSFDRGQSQGRFTITEPHFRTRQFAGLLNSDTILTVQANGREGNLQVLIPELDLRVSIGKNKQWSARVGDLKAIHDHSDLLQQFQLEEGQLSVSSPGGGAPYHFSADIPYGYPLLVHGNKPVERYHVSGNVSDGTLQAEVNGKVTVQYRDSLDIRSADIAYNIPAISSFLKDCLQLGDRDASDSKTFQTTLTATNSALYFSKKSQAIGDMITLRSLGVATDMKLESGPGTLAVAMEGSSFSVKGQHLNDTFMNSIIPDADLRNGFMAVAAQGKFDDFTALVKVTDTVLEDFVTLNNVLALVNTIPALITFSLPQYSSSGLPVTSFVAGVRVEDGMVNFESLDVESPELSMAATGWIDFPEKKIEMDLNLITQSKKNISKIPLVGFILAGTEKHPSITLRLSGDLQDPDVEHKVFQDVATLPFGILYRTLALPAHLAAPMFETEEKEEQLQGILEE